MFLFVTFIINVYVHVFGLFKLDNSLFPSDTVALADLRRDDLLLPPNMGSSSMAPGIEAVDNNNCWLLSWA